MSSPIQLVSVVDNGDAAILATREGVDDLGTAEAFLLAAADDHALTPAGIVRLVTTADAPALAAVMTRLAQLSAVGTHVDAVIVTRVPQAGDGWPKAWAKRQRADVERFVRECPVPVVTKRLRAAGDPIGSKQPRKRLRPEVEMPEIESREGGSGGGGYRWRIPVDALGYVDDVRVGTATSPDGVADTAYLVVDVDDVQAWRPLPAVLARCRATRAVADDTGLTVDFEPDPALWPGGAS